MATNRTLMTNAIDLTDNAGIQLAPLGGASGQGLTMQAWIRVRAAAMRGAKQASEVAVRERNKALEAIRACEAAGDSPRSAPFAAPTVDPSGGRPQQIRGHPAPGANDVDHASP